MPKYAWFCANGHSFDGWHYFENEPPLEIPTCSECGIPPAKRDYRSEFLSQGTVCDDDIRRAYLGSEIDRNLQAQGRPLDPLAPHDKFEAKHVEKALGRVHIGNDYSMLRPISQRAIERGPVTKPGKIVVSSS